MGGYSKSVCRSQKKTVYVRNMESVRKCMKVLMKVKEGVQKCKKVSESVRKCKKV